MTTAVTVEEKKDFIRWLLRNHTLKRREGVWLFNYMMTHDHLLQNVHFTDEVHFCPKAITLSTTESDKLPFRFHKGSTPTTDAEKAFSELRQKPEETTFIQINYPRREHCLQYARVFVDNPHIPAHLVKEKVAPTNELMDEIERAALLARIDTALDNNDEAMFMQLTEMLR